MSRFAIIHDPKSGGNDSKHLDCWVGVELRIPAEWTPICSTLSGDSRTTPLVIPGEVALEALGVWVGTGSPLYQHWQKALQVDGGYAGITLQPGEYEIVEK